MWRPEHRKVPVDHMVYFNRVKEGKLEPRKRPKKCTERSGDSTSGFIFLRSFTFSYFTAFLP